jgi:uncharacterized membrane protein YoaT (DUF817 family)
MTAQPERHLGNWACARLPTGLAEFVMFVLKQAWTALFGVLFVIAISASRLIWQNY